MTGSDISVGRAEAHDADALLALINLVQPHVPWDRAHLEWQFFAPPAGAARLYVVRDGSTIVSLYAAVAQRRDGGGTNRSRLHGAGRHDQSELPGARIPSSAWEPFAWTRSARPAMSGTRFPTSSPRAASAASAGPRSALVPRRGAPLPGPEPSSAPRAGPATRRGVRRRATAIWEAGRTSDRRAQGRGLPPVALREARRPLREVPGRWTRPGFVVLKHVRRRPDADRPPLRRGAARDGPRSAPRRAGVGLRPRTTTRGAASDRVASRRPSLRAGLRQGRAPPREEHDRYMFVTGPAELAVERQIWHVTQGDSDVY